MVHVLSNQSSRTSHQDDMLFLLFFLFATPFVLSTCPDGVPCIKKCCPIDQKISQKECVPHLGEEPPISVPEGVGIVHSVPKCEDELVTFVESDEHTLHHNGTVTYNGWVVEYCRDLNHDNVTATYVCEEVFRREPATPENSQGVLRPLPAIAIILTIALVLFGSSYL